MTFIITLWFDKTDRNFDSSTISRTKRGRNKGLLYSSDLCENPKRVMEFFWSDVLLERRLGREEEETWWTLVMEWYQRHLPPLHLPRILSRRGLRLISRRLKASTSSTTRRRIHPASFTTLMAKPLLRWKDLVFYPIGMRSGFWFLTCPIANSILKFELQLLKVVTWSIGFH